MDSGLAADLSRTQTYQSDYGQRPTITSAIETQEWEPQVEEVSAISGRRQPLFNGPTCASALDRSHTMPSSVSEAPTLEFAHSGIKAEAQHLDDAEDSEGAGAAGANHIDVDSMLNHIDDSAARTIAFETDGGTQHEVGTVPSQDKQTLEIGQIYPSCDAMASGTLPFDAEEEMQRWSVQAGQHEDSAAMGTSCDVGALYDVQVGRKSASDESEGQLEPAAASDHIAGSSTHSDPPAAATALSAEVTSGAERPFLSASAAESTGDITVAPTLPDTVEVPPTLTEDACGDPAEHRRSASGTAPMEPPAPSRSSLGTLPSAFTDVAEGSLAEREQKQQDIAADVASMPPDAWDDAAAMAVYPADASPAEGTGSRASSATALQAPVGGSVGDVESAFGGGAPGSLRKAQKPSKVGSLDAGNGGSSSPSSSAQKLQTGMSVASLCAPSEADSASGAQAATASSAVRRRRLTKKQAVPHHVAPVAEHAPQALADVPAAPPAAPALSGGQGDSPAATRAAAAEQQAAAPPPVRHESSVMRSCIGHELTPPEMGRTVKVHGDGWGCKKGGYEATITEADALTFTVIRQTGKKWEETHVLREHCELLPDGAPAKRRRT